MPKNKTELVALLKQATESQADWIEFRADFYQEVTSLEWATVVSKKPIIFTYRTLSQGGNGTLPTNELFTVLKKAIEVFPIVDIELTFQEDLLKELLDLAKDNGTQTILSLHDFEQTPSEEEILASFVKMENLGSDIAKIAVFPQAEEDVLRMISASQNYHKRPTAKPIISISMGDFGKITRLATYLTHSIATFASITTSSAQGQIPLLLTKEVLLALEGEG